ncbi:MAG: acyl-CoA dehydrogenase family protein [Maricaulaceae bacterium]
MALVLNDDEKLLAESAEGFLNEKAPTEALRKLRDERAEDGIDRALWAEMAEMGFAGVLIPEEHGGVDMGHMAAGLIAVEMGKNLTASPFLSSAILAATALKEAGSDAQKSEWLPKIASGATIVALAVDEGVKHNPNKIEMTATRSGNGFTLNGEKSMVVDGHIADHLIVAAKTSEDKLTLFLVDPKTSGVSTERTIMVDSRNAARIDFDNVDVTSDAVLGEVDQGADVLDGVLNAGRAVVAAELLGAGTQAFSLTTEYLKERKQFGTEIGRFQALQHRASHLYCELEIARSAVLAALTALDAKSEEAPMAVAMAKAKLGSVSKLTALEGVQMFGGVGMTDEYDIGLFLKRIRVAQELFGDEHYQLDQVGKMRGY